MAQVKFDNTINWGHIITVLISVGSALGAYYGLRGEISLVGQQQKSDSAAMDLRLRGVEGYMAKMTDMLVADARQDARILSLEKWRDRLEVHTQKVEAEARP